MTVGYLDPYDRTRPPRGESPARTPDGRPWVSWVKLGEYQGWRAGARPYSAGPKFWEVVLTVASEYFATAANSVHCLGPGILSVGVLGLTMRGGYAQKLLQQCLLTDPVRFVNVMAPVLQKTGARTKSSGKSPSSVVLVGQAGNLLTTDKDLRDVVMLGADSVAWSSAQKTWAHLWVSSVSELLRDEAMDRAQAEVAAELLPLGLSSALAYRIRWPRHGAEDTWQYPRARQALWAFAMLWTVEDKERAEEFLLEHVESADSTELEVVEAVDKALADTIKHGMLPSMASGVGAANLFRMVTEAFAR